MYTRHDTPQTHARITADLSFAVQEVRAQDPHAQSIILTGGFARGEGAVHNGVPQNDYDLVCVRSWRRPLVPYDRISAHLSRALGLHVDLAPVARWRLRWVAPTIFWYETALRGRTLWGPNLLESIPVRDARDLDPKEGLRLLANRAAGLLLATKEQRPSQFTLQAAKALLAALDANLLALGDFAPTHAERLDLLRARQRQGRLLPALAAFEPWYEWAYESKTQPEVAPPQDPVTAWKVAARAILAAVPHALHHAGLASLPEYARTDRLVDRLYYARRAARIPGAHRWVRHPTGLVRAITFAALEASLAALPPDADTLRPLERLAPLRPDPLETLQELRSATRQ